MSPTRGQPLISPTAQIADLSSNPPPPSFNAPQAEDPKVAELRIMFPTVEVVVIEMILESVGGSQDRAIEQLLSMTDPEFKPDESAHTRTEDDSQLDLDAQFARSLAMQEEQDAHDQRARGGDLPYQPRVRRNNRQGYTAQTGNTGPQDSYSSGNQGQNPPGMLAFDERVNQFAEAGKNTFTTLFSRAKAKVQEFQAQNAALSTQPDRAKESRWGETGDEDWRRPPNQSTPTPGGGRGGDQNRSQGLWDDGRSFSASSRTDSFESRSPIDPDPAPISPATALNPPPRQKPARWNPSDAYDDPLPPAKNGPASSNRIEVGGRRSPGVGSPDKGSTMGKIDPTKLGLLPKKKVDLLSTSPPATMATGSKVGGGLAAGAVTGGTTASVTGSNNDDDDDVVDPNPSLPSAPRSIVSQIPKTPPATSSYALGDSDDELEYTKNPFDER